MTPETNGWNEYKRLVLHEFEQINESIKELAITREADAKRNREDLKDTVAQAEKRICAKITDMEKRQQRSFKDLRGDVKTNAKDIVTLKIRAASWGAISGGVATILLKLIEVLAST